jgi:hypothetical protein
MSWTRPIYDRTSADIINRTSKAFLNVADWLRITNNTNLLRQLVQIMHGLTITPNTLVQPSITTFPAVDDINQLIENIEQLRTATNFPSASGVVALKHDYKAGNAAVAPDYSAVNAWEQDLDYIRAYLRSAAEYYLYCGTFSSGADRTFANRWRPWRGYIKPAYDPTRYVRMGSSCGASLTWRNRWRSPVDQRSQTPRCGYAICGTRLLRQNGFRRYA